MTLTDTDIQWQPFDGNGQPPRADAPTPTTIIVLAALLDQTEAFIRRYVVLTDDQAVALTLWVAHSHAFGAAECTPYVQVGSATKRSGKTRLLEVIETLVARPWFTGRTTAAALIRKIEVESPTLLLDESDAIFKGPQEFAEALRGVLNSGYRRGGKATVCIGQGAAVRPYDFNTFCPKAIAGIGRLPDTIQDRSIPIVLRRRTKLEVVSRWRDRDGHRLAKPIRAALAQWAPTAVAALRDARPDLPQALGDRAMDVWEPLFAIADCAGDTWPTRARHAAVNLMGEHDDDSIGIQLLTDVRDVFAESGDPEALASADILTKLAERDDRPWANWSKGKPITAHALARLLEPFEIVPGGVMRIAGKPTRAYRRALFADAWTRYLDEVPVTDGESPESIPAPPQSDGIPPPPDEDDTWKL